MIVAFYNGFCNKNIILKTAIRYAESSTIRTVSCANEKECIMLDFSCKYHLCFQGYERNSEEEEEDYGRIRSQSNHAATLEQGYI